MKDKYEVYTDCSVCNAFISNWSYHQGAYYCVNCIWGD